jgi:ABC-type transporter Mla subunit MlaD
MSSVNAVNQTNAAAAAENPAVTPEGIVEQLRAVRQQIPEFVQLLSADVRSIQSAASVHPQFAQAAINAIGASAIVQGVVGRTPEELQQDAETTARWSKVEDELLAMLRGVFATNLTRRHRLGQAALLTYSVSKNLVRLPEYAALLPHVAMMRKANRFGRRRVAPQQPPPPVPAPVPPTLE